MASSVTFMNAAFLYKIGLLGLFPLLIAVHGGYWVIYHQSLAPVVYAMKLVFLPFLAVGAIVVYRRVLVDKTAFLVAALVVPLFLLSLVSPFVTGGGLGFYYFTDAAGFIVSVGSVIVIYLLLRGHHLTVALFEKLLTWFLVIVSAYTIFYYYFSGGMKISITPEMQIPMAVAMGAYFFPGKFGYRPPVWLFFLVALACAHSLLRENIFVFSLLGMACMCGSFFYSVERGRILRFLFAVFFAFIVCFFLGVVDFSWGSSFSAAMHKHHEAGNAVAVMRVDGSVMQRYDEAALVFKEMSKAPFSFLLGKGFGATYENVDGVLLYYGERVHNIHSTPIAVYYRNGLYGIIVYLIPGIAAAFTIFSRNPFVFRTSLCVGILYATLFFNQYLYWNVQYGLAVAMWLYSLTRRDDPA